AWRTGSSSGSTWSGGWSGPLSASTVGVIPNGSLTRRWRPARSWWPAGHVPIGPRSPTKAWTSGRCQPEDPPPSPVRRDIPCLTERGPRGVESQRRWRILSTPDLGAGRLEDPFGLDNGPAEAAERILAARRRGCAGVKDVLGVA